MTMSSLPCVLPLLLVVLLHSPLSCSALRSGGPPAATVYEGGSSNIEDLSSSLSDQQSSDRLLEPDFCLCSCITDDGDPHGVLMLAEDGDLIEEMDGMYSFCTSHDKSDQYIENGTAKCERDCENYDDYIKMLRHYLKVNANHANAARSRRSL